MYVHIHWVDVTGGLVICSNLANMVNNVVSSTVFFHFI